jgi:hypothetical protein
MLIDRQPILSGMSLPNQFSSRDRLSKQALSSSEKNFGCKLWN